jgi:hypothetical protein
MATTKVIPGVLDLNQASSSTGLKMPSGAAYSGTAQDGMVRNDTDGDSQGSASTMQHFNGTDWKNYENLQGLPIVSTSAASNVASTSFTANGDLTNLGGGGNVSVGFYIGTDANYLNNTKHTVSTNASIGVYTFNATSLSASTTYYINSFAINNFGEFVASQVTQATTASVPFLLAGGQASGAIKSLRYSEDNGATWNNVTSSGFTNDSVLARVGYNGSYYLAYNINGELSNSTDGKNFTAVSGNGGLPASPQMLPKTLFWTGTRWAGVFGHNYPSLLGKVWTSTSSDGSSWSQTSPNDTCFFLDTYNDSIATWWVIPASGYPAYVSTTSGTPSWSAWGAKPGFGNQASSGGFTTSVNNFVINGGYSTIPAFTSNGFTSFSNTTGVATGFNRAFFKTDTTFFIQNEQNGSLYKSTNGSAYSLVSNLGAAVNLNGGYVYNGTDLFVGSASGSIYRTSNEFLNSTTVTPSLTGQISLTSDKIYDQVPNIT